ncbi:MmgE/PrpD family protein [Pseudonocardia benzenivorans]
MTISGRLAELVVGTEPAALPEATRTATSMHTLDTLGCALAALGLDAVPYVRASYAERGVSGPASVVGQAGGLPADMAAMVNGALAHALDYDDTHAGSIVHVSAATVPAALAMGEHTGRSGAEVLTAIALGNEVSVRLGRPAGPHCTPAASTRRACAASSVRRPPRHGSPGPTPSRPATRSGSRAAWPAA